MPQALFSWTAIIDEPFSLYFQPNECCRSQCASDARMLRRQALEFLALNMGDGAASEGPQVPIRREVSGGMDVIEIAWWQDMHDPTLSLGTKLVAAGDATHDQGHSLIPSPLRNILS